jgi:osmoprotectant transport system permease protein
VREVPADVKESARGMGMTGRQRFSRVELPLAMPLIASGVRLALVQVWATATIAALVAGPGLGRVITDGFYRTNYGKGIAGAVVVALVALVLEVLAALAQRAATPPGASTGGRPGGRSRGNEGPTSPEGGNDVSGDARTLEPASGPPGR